MKIIKRVLKWLFIFLVGVFCILSVVPYFFNDHLKEPPVKPFENSNFFEYAHTKFHYRLFVPKLIQHKIILIHGFSGSTFSFRNNYDSLLNNQSLVVAIDMPAFGYSDKTDNANYNDSIKIQAIHYLLNSIDKNSNKQPWHLVGHSMGGSIIGQFASAYPKQTKSLIFIDGLPFEQNTNSFLQKFILYPPLLKWADVILERNFLNYASFQKLLSSAYSQPADSLSVNGYMKPFETKKSGSAILRMGSNFSYVAINDSIIDSIPKIIIWGSNDQWIPLISATDYLKRPKTESVIIKNSGHCPMETNAKEVNTAINNFISKLE